MNRHPPLTQEQISKRLDVDVASGVVRWRDATKHHRPLVGRLAGYARKGRHDKHYWVIKINEIQYLRSQIVFAVKTGAWPDALIDHINGNSLDDRGENLRAATAMQNAWNHKTRAKASPLPMGVRRTRSGRYQARLSINKKAVVVGVFDCPVQAANAYQFARKEAFGDYA